VISKETVLLAVDALCQRGHRAWDYGWGTFSEMLEILSRESDGE